MKMYAVTQVVLCEENGTISMQAIIGVEHNKKDATALMRKAYDEELKQRKLEDNNAMSDDDEATSGGYFTDDEAGIYDYADFAFGQLLELVCFVISEIDVDFLIDSTENYWEKYHESDFGWDEYGIECPNCKKRYDNDDIKFKMNFCPNCGHPATEEAIKILEKKNETETN